MINFISGIKMWGLNNKTILTQ